MSKSSPVQVTYGSCIDFDLVFRDENGDPEDLTNQTFTVHSANPESPFAEAVLIKTDPVNGTVHFHLPKEAAAQLNLGNLNYLRIARTFPDGCVKTTDEIWIATR
ncbi:hypothetical protein [Chelativorans sp. Marseille-P2723]|uniref:hypothetical protein n=1 Tax=Chelativorans sp. Marseille-P2723 TaxID=2709133 RepID=UPI00156FB562|nr:hypothetical protein [Chelativorans sp. Marseille-P2723]